MIGTVEHMLQICHDFGNIISFFQVVATLLCTTIPQIYAGHLVEKGALPLNEDRVRHRDMCTCLAGGIEAPEASTASCYCLVMLQQIRMCHYIHVGSMSVITINIKVKLILKWIIIQLHIVLIKSIWNLHDDIDYMHKL